MNSHIHSVFEYSINAGGQPKTIEEIFNKYYNSIFNKLNKQGLRSIRTHTEQHSLEILDENPDGKTPRSDTKTVTPVTQQPTRPAMLMSNPTNNRLIPNSLMGLSSPAPFDIKFDIKTRSSAENNPIFFASFYMAYPENLSSHYSKNYKKCKTTSYSELKYIIEGINNMGIMEKSDIKNSNRRVHYPTGSDFVSRYISKYKPIKVFRTEYKKEIQRMVYNQPIIYIFLHKDYYVHLQLNKSIEWNNSITNTNDAKYELIINYVPFTNFKAYIKDFTELFRHPFLEFEQDPFFGTTAITGIAHKDAGKTPEKVIWDQVYDYRMPAYEKSLSFLSIKRKLNKDTIREIGKHVSYKDKYTNAKLKAFIEQSAVLVSSKSSSSSSSISSPKSPETPARQ